MLYANYLRNKMHHLVKAVFASGYPLKITSKFNRTAIDYTIHGKTKIGKNIIPFPYAFFGSNSTKTINGITFTSNADGTITLNDTSTASSYFTIILATNIINNIDKTKTYTISMENGIISKIDINLALYKGGKLVENVCTLSKPTVNFATYTKEFDSAVITLIIKANANFDNLIVKPMLEKGSTATAYETYTAYGVGDKTKNLIPYPYRETTKTQNGVTFTDNGDGTITVDGTATQRASFRLYNWTTFDKTKQYFISGCPSGGSGNTYQIYVSYWLNGTWVSEQYDYSKGLLLDLPNKTIEYDTIQINCVIISDTTVENLTFKPQLELGSTATDYEPYGYKIPFMNNTTITDIYIISQIKDGESISYRADNLPELQLYKGDNIITTNTEIKPTTIDIKYYN